MLTSHDRERIEDETGITPDQLRRLERIAEVFLSPTLGDILAAAIEQRSRDRRTFGCPSEAH